MWRAPLAGAMSLDTMAAIAWILLTACVLCVWARGERGE